MMRRAAVIGAGPAGCHAAYLLQRTGREVVLFEQGSSVGGRTSSWEEGGWVIDSGAGFFTNFYPTLWSLLAELGLEGGVTPLSRSNFLTDGTRTVDFRLGSLTSFARYLFLGGRAKMRVAMQTLLMAARYRRLDLSRPATLARWDDASVQEEAIRRVGEQAYHYLVRPGIEPFWYVPCDQVSRSLMLALQARAPTARFYTLRNGMNSLCRRLARDLDVRTDASVESIERRGTGFAVRLAEDSDDRPFDEVVIATTGTVADRLTASLRDGEVPKLTRRFLSTQAYVANTHVAFRVADRARLPKMSALFPCGPHQSRVAAINFNSQKNQQREAKTGQEEVVSVFLTADESQATLGLSEGKIFAHAWRLARGLCPDLPGEAVPLAVVQRREAIPVHAVGRYRLAAEVVAGQRGPLVFAGDYLATATVDGALRSGLEAVRALRAFAG